MCLGLYVVVTEVHVTVMALHVTLRIVGLYAISFRYNSNMNVGMNNH